MHFTSTVFVLLACVSTMHLVITSNISLIIALPLHQNLSAPWTSWERGLEILPGALVAVNGINDNSSVLPEQNLQLIVVDSSRHEYEVLQQFVDLSFYNTHKNIVGLSGFLSPKAVSLLSPIVRQKGVLLSAITDYLIPENNSSLPAVHSPSAMINALLSFMKRMNWKRVGLITKSTDAYFFNVAEMLLQMAETDDNISIAQYIELLHITSAVHEVVKLNTRIIFVSVNVRKAMQLICALYNARLLWPDYAWIFHSYAIEDFLDQPAVCDIKSALDGIIIIDYQLPFIPSQRKLISGITFSSYYEQYLSRLSAIALEYNTTFRENGYAKLLYDLVWATAITLNNSCSYQSTACAHQADATSAQELYRQRDWIIKISHVIKLRPVLVGTVYCNSSVTELSFNDSVLVNAPTDELPLLNADPPFGYAIGVASQIVLTTLFVTLILLLYILFHKEPEIKATSFTLSLLIFAGCYLNLIYLALLYHANVHAINSINIVSDNALCILLQWLSAPGISLPLMLAILLVKMLRVYHIFNHVNLRLGRYCSDLSLTCYILLILAPNILVNLIWIIVDRYEIHFEYKVQDGVLHLDRRCNSTHQVVWFGILTVYLLVLVLALAIVAVITRRVRLKHFKDTKKVNVLLFILCLGIVITFSYWLLLQTLDTKFYIQTLPLHVGHSVLVLSFQSFLFVPKVFPPLWRFIKRKFH